ncbi:MAG: folylpolyglutamate synthase/dihydrofolate synthase family protein [Gallicola sp.]|nr:folylpolyglutamate synthase/dihydrofolate synthase family protein [Gallicola sp.]
MDRNEADRYLEMCSRRGFVLGLDNMEQVLEALNRPDHQYDIIHVAGTNGKGSTCTMTQNILTENGYKTGLYTSPQLYKINDRIHIDHEEISDEDYLEVFNDIVEICEREKIPITEFELITAIAFEYFARKECDFVVLEVGMGGRLDATNIVDQPLLTVITSIGLDHTDYLGETLEEIAHEKGGIIKSTGPVILYPQEKEVEDVICSIAEKKDVVVIFPDFQEIQNIEVQESFQSFDYKGKRIELGLMGTYQIKNSAMVLEIINYLENLGYSMNWKKVLQGFKNTKMVARLQKVQDNPVILLDGAHNEQGISELKKALTAIYPNQKFVFIFGVLKDKEYIKEVEILSTIAKAFIAVEPDYPERKLESSALKKLLDRYSDEVTDLEKIPAAIDYANKEYKNEIIIICGSFYQVKDVLDYYNN